MAHPEIELLTDDNNTIVGKFCLLIDFDWLYADFICNIAFVLHDNNQLKIKPL